MLRAGFTDVFVTGMLMRWINVKPRPMAMGANPWGARPSVAPSRLPKDQPIPQIQVTAGNVPDRKGHR